MKKIIKIILIVLFIISLPICFAILNHRRLKQHNENYKLLTMESELKGKLNNIIIEKGCCFLTIDNNKISIAPSRNNLYPKESLSKYLSIGDTIIKKSGSDTIYLCKKDQKYFFIHGKSIN